VYGRAYGFERAMDSLGAIGGPLLAIALIDLVGVRAAIGLSVIPGLLAAVAIIYAIRHTAVARARTHQPIRIRIRPVLRGRLGRLLVGVLAFELGNAVATLLILRATVLLETGRGQADATQLALVLYVLYNMAATVISVPAGWRPVQPDPGPGYWGGLLRRRIRHLRRRSPPHVAAGDRLHPGRLGIGCGETGQSAAVAALAPATVRGSAFGCSPRPRQAPTSPPAPSPESSGPPSPRPLRSASWPQRWSSRSRSSWPAEAPAMA
jgi:hypothetical protein